MARDENHYAHRPSCMSTCTGETISDTVTRLDLDEVHSGANIIVEIRKRRKKVVLASGLAATILLMFICIAVVIALSLNEQETKGKQGEAIIHLKV